MGSGETTPTMAKLHRQLFERVGTCPSVVLDTPYGFQSNAADISARALRYFQESAGREVALASLPRAEGVPRLMIERAQAQLAGAGWAFSGPGSPTYALRQWRLTSVPRLLGDKLREGGCLVFSSAAALTLGRWAVPVYEIYKAGASAEWHEGLDLLAPFGLEVAVIPHYDNAEGGTHDTRYCYLGEERLQHLESLLPAGGWVLGVDEHTACVLDFDAGTVSVTGLGTLTLRHQGKETKYAAGSLLALGELAHLAAGAGGVPVSYPGPQASVARLAPASTAVPPASPGPEVPGAQGDPRLSPFLSEIAGLDKDFDQALVGRDAQAATEATLGLESSLHEWSADTFESDEIDRARGSLRRAVLRLGEAAGPGMLDRREVVGPWVAALLEERDAARQAGRYADADRIRAKLAALGVEVRDTGSSTTWELRGEV